MRTLMTYPLPTGPRALVAVEVPEGEYPLTLLDVPADDPLPPDCDLRVVEHRLADEDQAYRIATLHMLRSERLGRPAPPFAA
ncbi:MAG TPA: hypothetical protein VF529_00140 [Solirubrobacteraceae bacterium]|jgi:hypothetical protein